MKDPAMRVSYISIVINIVLSGIKLVIGLAANSSALVSDAVHSASDVLSTFGVIAGIRLSRKSSDRSHPYGHERLECVFSVILAVVLFVTGIGIGIKAVNDLIHPSGEYTLGIAALFAAGFSIVIKELMYQYTKYVAKKVDSGVLMADAWHHRSDALSSIGSFIGILGVKMGFFAADAAASLIICIFICKAAADIFKEAIDQMVDHACDDETIEFIKEIIKEQRGVCGIDDLKTRLFGSRIYVDVEISADGDQSLSSAHAVAESVHKAIESEIPKVKHCMVHVNPQKPV